MFDQIPVYSPLELMRLPVDERERYVRYAFSLAENEDFEVFEADSINDISDSLHIASE